jgi:uncharacterized protein
VSLRSDGLRASGVAVGLRPVPYRLDYRLETAPGWITTSLRVTARGEGWRRLLHLRRDADGRWSAQTWSRGVTTLDPPGGDLDALTGALDCDLGLSPLTNTMPVLRHGFLRGRGSAETVAVWVAVPDLSVHRATQRYTSLGRSGDLSVVRYESGPFAADIRFDGDGLVLDYPGLASRIRS